MTIASILRVGPPGRGYDTGRAVTLVIQVNGKLRDRLNVSVSITEDEAKKLALESPKVTPHLEGKQIVKVIYVPGKLINLVVR